FGPAVQRLVGDEHRVFVELSPHAVLLPAIEQGVQYAGESATVVASLQRDGGERASLLQALGTLYTIGCDVAWPRLYPSAAHVPLPTYPWQHARFWFSDGADDGVRDVRRLTKRDGEQHVLPGRV